MQAQLLGFLLGMLKHGFGIVISTTGGPIFTLIKAEKQMVFKWSHLSIKVGNFN